MRALVLSILLGASSAAPACGYCVEDKVASVYDHALIGKALARRHHVVFFHIEGTVPQGDKGKKLLEGYAYSVPAVERGSVRVSPETLTLAVAFDPARTSLADVQARMEKKLASRGLALMALRIIDAPADLKLVKKEFPSRRD